MKTAGDDPPEIRIFQCLLETYSLFAFSNIFKIKWLKFEEELNFGGWWVWARFLQIGLGGYESAPPPPPQSKLCGNALGDWSGQSNI